MQKLEQSHPCGVLELSLPRSLVRSREITLMESYLSSAENFTEINFYRKPRSSKRSLLAAAGNVTETQPTGSGKPKLQIAGREKKKINKPHHYEKYPASNGGSARRGVLPSERQGGSALSPRARRVSPSRPPRDSGGGVRPTNPHSPGPGGGGFPSAAFICLWRAPESSNPDPSTPRGLSPHLGGCPGPGAGGRALGAAGAGGGSSAHLPAPGTRSGVCCPPGDTESLAPPHRHSTASSVVRE